MSLRIPTSITIPLEKKGLTYRFVTKVVNNSRQITCEIRTRDTNQLVLAETAANENDALRKAAQAADAVPRPLSDGEARRKVTEQERKIRELEAKLARATPPAENESQADEPKQPRGRRSSTPNET